MKIFPYRDAKGNTLQWYAQSDRLPHEWEMSNGLLPARQ